MWLLVMFDLPVDTRKARKDYTVFRKALVKDGFSMMQFSVMVRHCPTEENAEVHRQRVKETLPPDGEVRIVTLTDKQFERMQVFHGRLRGATEPAPEQLTLFDDESPPQPTFTNIRRRKKMKLERDTAEIVFDE